MTSAAAIDWEDWKPLLDPRLHPALDDDRDRVRAHPAHVPVHKDDTGAGASGQ